MSKESRIVENMTRPYVVLLAECRGHLDRKLARNVVRERHFDYAFELLDLYPEIDLTSMVEHGFRKDSSRQEFLAFYLEEVKAKVAGKANCGCIHHAEQYDQTGVLCEHDLALLGPAPAMAPPLPDPREDPGAVIQEF